MKTILCGVLITLLITPVGQAASAKNVQIKAKQMLSPAPRQQGPADPEESEAFLDGIVPR